MELIPLDSTNIAYIGYDPDQMLMQISFKNGWTYAYKNVEPDTYSAMMGAPDPGRYFAEIIKPQRIKYPYTRMV